MDPLAIKYPALSPYHYVLDNPIAFVDFHGDTATGSFWDSWKRDFYGPSAQEQTGSRFASVTSDATRSKYTTQTEIAAESSQLDETLAIFMALGGGSADAGKYSLVSENGWKGQNGEWVPFESQPNGTSGPRGPILKTARTLGEVGSAASVLGFAVAASELTQGWNNDDPALARRGGLDLAATLVATSGPVGLEIASCYFLVQLLSDNTIPFSSAPLQSPQRCHGAYQSTPTTRPGR